MTRDEEDFLDSVGFHVDHWFDESEFLEHCDGGQEPCYVTRCTTKNGMNTEEKVDRFIEICAKYSKMGILMFSVTRNDTNNKVFRETAAQYVGATICETKSRHHGGYPCWLICIPVE